MSSIHTKIAHAETCKAGCKIVQMERYRDIQITPTCRKALDEAHDARACEACEGPIGATAKECGSHVCADCCEHEHDPDEGFMCLNCGNDGSDYIAAMADYYYDQAKDGS